MGARSIVLGGLYPECRKQYVLGGLGGPCGNAYADEITDRIPVSDALREGGPQEYADAVRDTVAPWTDGVSTGKGRAYSAQVRNERWAIRFYGDSRDGWYESTRPFTDDRGRRQTGYGRVGSEHTEPVRVLEWWPLNHFAWRAWNDRRLPPRGQDWGAYSQTQVDRTGLPRPGQRPAFTTFSFAISTDYQSADEERIRESVPVSDSAEAGKGYRAANVITRIDRILARRWWNGDAFGPRPVHTDITPHYVLKETVPIEDSASTDTPAKEASASDRVQISDDLLAGHDLGHGLNEILAVSDSLFSSEGFGERLPETVSIADAAESVPEGTVRLAESLVLSDTLTPALGFLQREAERISLTESLLSEAALASRLAETVPLEDAAVSAPEGTSAVAEIVPLTDAVSASAATVRALAERMPASDTLVSRAALISRITETARIVDSLVSAPEGTAAAAEIIELIEELGSKIEISEALADGTGLSDSADAARNQVEEMPEEFVDIGELALSRADLLSKFRERWVSLDRSETAAGHASPIPDTVAPWFDLTGDRASLHTAASDRAFVEDEVFDSGPLAAEAGDIVELRDRLRGMAGFASRIRERPPFRDTLTSFFDLTAERIRDRIAISDRARGSAGAADKISERVPIADFADSVREFGEDLADRIRVSGAVSGLAGFVSRLRDLAGIGDDVTDSGAVPLAASDEIRLRDRLATDITRLGPIREVITWVDSVRSRAELRALLTDRLPWFDTLREGISTSIPATISRGLRAKVHRSEAGTSRVNRGRKGTQRTSTGAAKKGRTSTGSKKKSYFSSRGPRPRRGNR